MLRLLALVAVTAVWGITFIQVKDAVELYPLFAFLAVRFAIAALVLAGFAARRVRSLGRDGVVAGAALGGLLATGHALQTAGSRARPSRAPASSLGCTSS
jgi:drug/metabolite transporter (DMT)-like permease